MPGTVVANITFIRCHTNLDLVKLQFFSLVTLYPSKAKSFNEEKAMAPHSSTLAWKIPWMEEPGRLQSMGSRSRTRLSNFTFTFMCWRRKWQPTPAFLPGESQGRGSLVCCRLWVRTESHTTEAT